MTVAALLQGFGLSLAGSVDRDEMQNANEEDTAAYGGLLISYQTAFMGTSFAAGATSALTLFAVVTVYVGFRTIIPQTNTEATLFYKLSPETKGLYYVRRGLSLESSIESSLFMIPRCSRIQNAEHVHTFAAFNWKLQSQTISF